MPRCDFMVGIGVSDSSKVGTDNRLYCSVCRCGCDSSVKHNHKCASCGFVW